MDRLLALAFVAAFLLFMGALIVFLLGIIQVIATHVHG